MTGHLTLEFGSFAPAITSHVFCYLSAAPHLLAIRLPAEGGVRNLVYVTPLANVDRCVLSDILLERVAYGRPQLFLS